VIFQLGNLIFIYFFRVKQALLQTSNLAVIFIKLVVGRYRLVNATGCHFILGPVGGVVLNVLAWLDDLQSLL